MKSARLLNGYNVVYDPNHPRAMKSAVWLGYVYEHIKVATSCLGRSLKNDEVVHHLDGNRLNNRTENLLVLLRSEHFKLHMWLDGISGRKPTTASVAPPLVCSVCGKTLQRKQKYFCSNVCTKAHRQASSACPSYTDLMLDFNSNCSFCALGRKYGVSDNAVRKWFRQYGLPTKTRLRSSPNVTTPDAALIT